MLAPGHYFVLRNAFLAAGFNVAAINLTGHGLCRPPCWRLDVFSFSELLEQGLQAEKWLIKHNYGPVVVSGHSQGGILTLAHAATSATCKAAIAISAVFPQMYEAASLTLFKGFAQKRPQIMRIIGWLAQKFPRLPIPLPFYLNLRRVIAQRKQPTCIGAAKSRTSYPVSFLFSLFNAHIPLRLHCPFLLMNAANDALFTPQLIRLTFAAVETQSKELLFLPAGGHMAPYNPWLAQYIARNAAVFCASQNLPIYLSSMEH